MMVMGQRLPEIQARSIEPWLQAIGMEELRLQNMVHVEKLSDLFALGIALIVYLVCPLFRTILIAGFTYNRSSNI